jgi:hypothetical protein
MKTIEYDKRVPKWVNTLLNSWPLCLDEDSVKTIYCRCMDNQGLYIPGEESLYMNGLWFIRLCSPFGIFIGLKLNPLGSIWQFGLGWKGNGRCTITLRSQTWQESADGVLGPNVGHAKGWDRGTA